jgi:thiamine transport system ATP-binding protein
MVDVTFDSIRKEYGTDVAVESIDLTVADGEILGVVGPSGCGKTTTLRLIAGFESPTSGTVRFGGEDVAGVPPEDRNAGVVFQNYALFGHMTVAENVAYGLHFADPPGDVTDDERVAELLELVDLPGTQDRNPDSLSGGQRQRVAMARALAPGPDVLLLDEPMSALDAKLREQLRVQVREIQQELNITTVYVTHDQEEALAVSDRVAVMNDGSAEQVAPPRDVYHRPDSRFVAEFVGDNNVFEGEVRDVSDGVATVDVSTEALAVGIDDQRNRRVSVGDRLAFCVRPESLAVDGGQNRLDGRVGSAEFLGETTRVHLDWRGQELTVRTRKPLSGEVTVGFDPDDAHVFERRD